jgi:HK97 family phage major capsid protein
MKKDLEVIKARMSSIQDEYRGKRWPEDVAKEFNRLADEGEFLQKEIESERERTARFDRIAKTYAQEPEEKAAHESILPVAKARREGVVAYMSLGDFVAASEDLKGFLGTLPKHQVQLVEADVRMKGRKRAPVVALKSDAYNAIQQKAPPTIADRVIPYDRDQDLVLGEEYIPPTLLDVLNIVQTNSPTVEWVRRNTRTRGAATQSEVISNGVQGLKGQASQGYELVTTPIRTHAVWQPVTEQQLADWPQLSALINADLNDDMNQYLEEQVLYGDGNGLNFDGFFNGTNVSTSDPARADVNDTIIDSLRRCITEIRRAQFAPNAVIMDPFEWEEIVLTKDDDAQYIRTVVNEGDGASRIWALPVIDTVKMEDRDTGERNILIGDFARGATLYDRMTRTVSVGLIDDQFVRNMRTILMEARAGFAIRRPDAFRKIVAFAGS